MTIRYRQLKLKCNTSWSAPGDIDGSISLHWVSCASASFCAAVDGSGNAVTYNGTSWSAPSDIDGTHDITSVSCPSVSFCQAVDGDGGSLTFNGTSWSPRSMIDLLHNLTSVSCSSVSFCAATDNRGDAFTWNGTSWSAPSDIDGNAFLYSVSCSSASSCLAVADGGSAITYNAGTWSAPDDIDGTAVIDSVSCSSATFCVAVDKGGGSFVYNGASWSADLSIGDSPHVPTSVSCSSASFCAAVDDGGNAIIGEAAPVFTSALSTTFVIHQAGTFAVTATGATPITFTESGTLPSGVSFTAGGILSGTPASGSAPIYPIKITATDVNGNTATQEFTLIVAPKHVVGGPSISGIAPNTGPTTGGTLVTVTGSGFVGVSSVTFGARRASTFTVVDGDLLTAVSPPEPAGLVAIAVTAESEITQSSEASQFTYDTNAPATQPNVSVASTDSKGLTLHVSLPPMSLTPRQANGQNYVDLYAPGMQTNGTGSGSIGTPEIPLAGSTVALPVGTCEPSVEVLSSTGYTLGSVLLWPAQPPTAASAAPGFKPYPVPPFTIDATAYQSNAPTPLNEAVVGPVQSSRGLSMTNISFFGASYRPASQTLTILTSLQVRADYGCKPHQKVPIFGTTALTAPANIAFAKYYASLIVNWNSVVRNLKRYPRSPSCGYQMIIITSSGLLPAAQLFQIDKAFVGMSSVIATTDGPDGIGTTATDVRNYILNLYVQCSGPNIIPPSYVTLIGSAQAGDANAVPTFEISLGSSTNSATGAKQPLFIEDPIATDVPYGYMHQTTPIVDGQILSSAFIDFQQDLFVGRIPVAPNQTSAEALSQAESEINTIANYETSYVPKENITGGEFWQPCNDLGCGRAPNYPGVAPASWQDANCLNPSTSHEIVVPSLFTGTANYVGDAIVDYQGVIPPGTFIVSEDKSNHSACLSSQVNSPPSSDGVIVYTESTGPTEVNCFMASSEQGIVDPAERAGLLVNRLAADDEVYDPGLGINPQYECGGVAIPRDDSISWYGGASGLEKAVNSGTDLLWQSDHGWEDGWAAPDQPTDPSLSTGDLESTSLTGFVPLVLGVSCDTAKFDDPTTPLTNPDGDANVGPHPSRGFGETWLETNHGAAYIGASREEYIALGDPLTEAFGYYLFQQRPTLSGSELVAGPLGPNALPISIGQLLAEAKNLMELLTFYSDAGYGNTQTYLHYQQTDAGLRGAELEFNILGDPSMQWSS